MKKKAFDLCERVLIYGTGLIAQSLVKKFQNSRIVVVGVLDRVKISGDFMDIPIVEWWEIEEGYADSIIIAAPNKYYKEIYARIWPYCLARDISILDASGNRLDKYFGVRNTSIVTPCYSDYYFEQNDILKKIEDYDVISFDIFDTLLMRLVVDPLDVFSIVENRHTKTDERYKGFRKLRREAELMCDNGNIDDIYQKIQELMDLNKVEIANLKKEELECENKSIISRNSVIDLFNYSLLKRKKVILTSDMYLPSDVLRWLLKSNGIQGYDRIFVSCEYGKSKCKDLFGDVVAQYPNQKILHIGDDYLADVLSPRRYGVDSIGIMKAIELLKHTPIGVYIGSIKTIADSMWIGQMANHLFNNPFIGVNSLGRLKIDSLSSFNCIYFEPLILEYISYLLKCLKNIKYDALLFVARDGYIIQKAYERLRENGIISGPKSEYIACSRKIAISVGMETLEEMRYLLEFYNADTKDNPLERIWGITSNGFEINSSYNESKILGLVKEHISQSRQAYILYLNTLGINMKGKYLLCELDGCGTSAYYLNHIFEQELHSFYLERSHVKKKYEGRSIACYDISEMEYSPFLDYVVVIENMFTSQNPSLSGIRENGDFIYGEDDRTIDDISFLDRMHEKVLNEVLSKFQTWEENGSLSRDLVKQIFETIGQAEFYGECENINHWTLKDDVLNCKLTFR